ncbi:MAG: TolC family protein, partial [Salinimicrobium sediminis]|nr:TolC family protein [Salinimicrobium sediminis]
MFSCSPRLSPADAPIPQPEAFSYTGTAELSDKWWENFEDPVLDSLIEQGLEQNLELAGNWEQFQAALAVVDRESSFFWPQVDATAGTAVTRPRDEFSRNGDLQVGLSASYELDLWGRIRAAVQAEEFRAQATLFDYQAAAMSISAEISITWYRLLSARKQLELADEQI